MTNELSFGSPSTRYQTLSGGYCPIQRNSPARVSPVPRPAHLTRPARVQA